ncbi:MAG: hypothetical protein ACI8RD_004719 [Bacillariaceae sp.]|jgi:hypothetical protein
MISFSIFLLLDVPVTLEGDGEERLLLLPHRPCCIFFFGWSRDDDDIIAFMIK